MSLLTHCTTEIDEYSFRLKNNTAQQVYDNAGEDWNTYTNITLKIYKVNDSSNYLEMDITSDFAYMFTTLGLVINFTDFAEATFNGYDYFPDWLYTTSITYTYDGTEYTDSYTIGYHAIISRVVIQDTKQSDWKEELSCSCSCEKYNTVLRKWDFFWQMRVAAELCLINEWLRLMQSLYKLTATTHEFDT